MFSFGKKKAFVFLFQLSFLAKSITLPDHPQNLAVTVGKRVEMKCKPDNISRVVDWVFQRPLSRKQYPLWIINWVGVPEVVAAHYDFDVDEDFSVTLNINSTRLYDAGIYTCTSFADNTTKQPNQYSAQLTVFESDPQCNTNISIINGAIEEFDYIEFRCSVNFSGYWAPSMQWSKNGNNMSESSIVVNINISQGVQQMTSVINMKVRAESNDALITCKTLFIETTENIKKTSATNVPEYLFSWNTTLDIFFGSRNVTITPKKDTYQWKDVLNCYGVGNPSPSYTWRKAHKTIANGSQLALNEAGLETNRLQTIECIARNQISAQIKLSSATVDIIISDNSLSINILPGIICAIVLIILILIGKERMKENFRTQVNLTNEDPESSSSDYESTHETEIDASPATATTLDTAAPNEDAFDAYSALNDRIATVQEPPVYCALNVSRSQVVAPADQVCQMTPVYANIAQH